MTWEQSGPYAYRNGSKAISRKYIDGCTMFCAHDGNDYVKHTEDEADAVLALITDKAEMREFLAMVKVHRGAEYAERLRQECLTLWNEGTE